MAKTFAEFTDTSSMAILVQEGENEDNQEKLDAFRFEEKGRASTLQRLQNFYSCMDHEHTAEREFKKKV